MDVKTKYDLRQYVYLIHDPEQVHRMITDIHIHTPRLFSYDLCSGSESSTHYEHELSLEKNQAFQILKSRNDADDK